ncbi:MAG: TlpA family protein disulfide reductase [Prolixibacteraceae bacterium]|nr:TlpA family protein disulfide reductase [Prolixibacteraceae bacterium]
MRYLLFVVLLLPMSFASAQEQNVPADYGYIVKIGQQVPDFEMELADGKKVKMSDLKGKVVMLQFTASWCGVCRKEMPHIEKEIWNKHKSNNKFALFGIDLNEPTDKVRKFGKEVGITYPLALDPEGGIFYSFVEKGAGVTRNVIIDKNGKIVFLTRLFQEAEFNEMKNVIEKMLKE